MACNCTLITQWKAFEGITIFILLAFIMRITLSKEQMVCKKTMCSFVISYNRRHVLNSEFCDRSFITAF